MVWPFTLLAALGLVTAAALLGWRGWLELRRLEVSAGRPEMIPVSRIEVADLRERIRKLERIAAGIDP